MIDQLLRDRFDDATADIRPVSRLDEILAAEPTTNLVVLEGRRPPRRRGGSLAAAAIIVVVVAVAAYLVGLSTGRDETTRLRLQPASTTTPVATTTPTGDGDRIGGQLSILASTLPPGMRLIDELPASADADGAVISRYATTDGRWTGEGPYLRISVDGGPDYAAQWAVTDRGEPVAQVHGADAFRTIDPTAAGSTLPGQDPWLLFTWATGPDQVISIQSKGVSDDDVLAIADSVVVRP